MNGALNRGREMVEGLKWMGVLLMLAVNLAGAEEAGVGYPPNAAEELVAAATKQAVAESKLLFLKSGWPECGYCRMMDRYHHTPEVETILGAYYVVVSININDMPDGKDVFSRFAKPGGPSWAIAKPDGDVIATSFTNGDKGNTGFPVKPNELAHYFGALEKATPSISQNELDILSAQLRKIYGR